MRIINYDIIQKLLRIDTSKIKKPLYIKRILLFILHIFFVKSNKFVFSFGKIKIKIIYKLTYNYTKP